MDDAVVVVVSGILVLVRRRFLVTWTTNSWPPTGRAGQSAEARRNCWGPDWKNRPAVPGRAHLRPRVDKMVFLSHYCYYFLFRYPRDSFADSLLDFRENCQVNFDFRGGNFRDWNCGNRVANPMGHGRRNRFCHRPGIHQGPCRHIFQSPLCYTKKIQLFSFNISASYVNQSINRSRHQSITQSIDQWNNHSINKSTDGRLIDWLNDYSINQSISRSINT